MQRIVVVFLRSSSNFFSDRYQSITETVKFSQIFRFSWLDHQSSGNRERNRWSVETVIHQTFSDITNFNSVCFERTTIQDHFVSCSSALSSVKNRVVTFETRFHVVSVQDSMLCSTF